jgi:hypothetical protein
MQEEQALRRFRSAFSPNRHLGLSAEIDLEKFIPAGQVLNVAVSAVIKSLTAG